MKSNLDINAPPVKEFETTNTAQFCTTEQASPVSNPQTVTPLKLRLLAPTFFASLPKPKKKILLIRFEGAVFWFPTRCETFACSDEDLTADKIYDKLTKSISKRAPVIRTEIKSFLAAITMMYRVYLYSSLDKQTLIRHAASHDISTYIEGYIGGINEIMTIEELVQGTTLETTLEIDNTLLVDIAKKIICLNRKNGILINPITSRTDNSNLQELADFLVYVAQKKSCTPIIEHFKDYSMKGQVNHAREESADVDDTGALASDRSIHTKETLKYNQSPLKRPEIKLNASLPAKSLCQYRFKYSHFSSERGQSTEDFQYFMKDTESTLV